MWKALEEVFAEIEEETGMPFSRQGSYEAEDELPSSFFTFFNIDSTFGGFYNNKPSYCDWEWQIMFYTNDPANIYSGLETFIEKASKKGFQFKSKGRDIVCDEPNYNGRTVKTTYIENVE